MTIHPHETSYELSGLEIRPGLFFSGHIIIAYADCEDFVVSAIDGSLFDEDGTEEVIYLTDRHQVLFFQIFSAFVKFLHKKKGDSLEDIVRDADTHRND